VHAGPAVRQETSREWISRIVERSDEENAVSQEQPGGNVRHDEVVGDGRRLKALHPKRYRSGQRHMGLARDLSQSAGRNHGGRARRFAETIRTCLDQSLPTWHRLSRNIMARGGFPLATTFRRCGVCGTHEQHSYQNWDYVAHVLHSSCTRGTPKRHSIVCNLLQLLKTGSALNRASFCGIGPCSDRTYGPADYNQAAPVLNCEFRACRQHQGSARDVRGSREGQQ
jgi:hypothetical protein